jgi:predicted nucleic acid-binding protein
MSLVLVDTSIWINLLGKNPRYKLSADDMTRMATCLPVVQEVLQGIRDDLVYKKISEAFLALPLLGEALPLEYYLEAAQIFRLARRKGCTVRSSVDCLIAAIAIKHDVAVWHLDRDFDVIAKFSNLKIYTMKN